MIEGIKKARNAELAERLIEMGFIVGERDPNRNQAFAGKYMVAELIPPENPQITQDASAGEWCVVGDDLDELIERSYESNCE